MGIIEIVFLSISLSMDAFSVSVCQGLKMQKFDIKKALIISLFFGVAQAVMPLFGWLIGIQFEKYITNIDHWIAFGLLSIIGLKMIIETFNKENECECNLKKFSIKEIFILAIATSIDALAIGVTFSIIQQQHIVISCLIIGIITFLLSFLGVRLGKRFGERLKKWAEFFGGLILIAIGLKILIEHLFF